MTDAREKLLRQLLQKIATEQKYDNPDIKIVALPATGGNFTSQLFRATIKSTDKKDLNVFAKVTVMNGTLREEAGHLFDIEPKFYTKIAKRYKEIEDKHDVPQEHRLILPKFYGHSDDYLEEVLVLQDLSKDGFVTCDRLKPIDWDFASKTIEEMAKFHALSIAYQTEYPEEFQNVAKTLKTKIFDETGPMNEMYKQSIGPVIQKAREEYKPKLRKFFFETFNPQRCMKFYLPNKRPVIVHNDYKLSNMMHKTNDNGKLQIAVVDFQTLLPGSVAIDLLYFIFTASDGAFRAQYYDQLIEHYYESLAVVLRRLNLDPEKAFPRTVFDEELKEALPFGLIITSMTLPMILIDLVDVIKTEDGEYEYGSLGVITDMLGKSNELSARRLNEVIEDYVKWGII